MKDYTKRNRIICIIIGIIATVAIVVIGSKIYTYYTKPIDERAYDMAVSVVERDILNSINPYFEEYDPKYIKWISLDLLRVEINVSFIHNGIWKDMKYEVYVDISDGQCLPGLPTRVFEENE